MNNPTTSRPNDLPAVLKEIIEHKAEEVAQAKRRDSIASLSSKIKDASALRDFFAALVAEQSDPPKMRVIAEIKRQSPSAGLIRPDYEQDGFKPQLIAQQYSQAGASAISCLTDENFFGGSLTYINLIKETVDLPVIRKDFIIDEYQIHEARAYGADAVLLIAECLDDDQIRRFLDSANELGLAILLEVHSKANLTRVQPLIQGSTHKRVLLGINNRDLTRMITKLSHTTDLLDLVQNRSILVSESGIKTRNDIQELESNGVAITLIGEHLMRQPNPGNALQALIGNNG
ncbi:MAG: indole-3-glycerol phosphate synthase TrpC [Phycisphaerales bacterium]|nr:indole-3-glycerol phosphate synthase TrpC [Phycisphaerales bacterium]